MAKKLVKIALVMDSEGNYYACGWSGATKKDILDCAIEGFHCADTLTDEWDPTHTEKSAVIEVYVNMPTVEVIQAGVVTLEDDVPKEEPANG